MKNQQPLKIASFYNPKRNNNITKVLWEEIKDKNTILLDDFNAHSCMWESCKSSIKAGSSIENWIVEQEGLNILFLFGLPTHYNIKSNKYSTTDLQIGPTLIIPYIEISQVLELRTKHSALLVQIDNQKHDTNQPTHKFNLRKANWNQFMQELDKANYNELNDENYMEFQATKISHILECTARPEILQIPDQRNFP